MRFAVMLALPLALLAAQPATSQAVPVVNVRLTSFDFTPRTIVLDRGKTYLLRLSNASKDGHDFTAPAFFAASNIAPADRPKVVEGQVEVHPGMTHQIRVTAPAAAGRYKLKCTHRFHKMLGMSGSIVIR